MQGNVREMLLLRPVQGGSGSGFVKIQRSGRDCTVQVTMQGKNIPQAEVFFAMFDQHAWQIVPLGMLQGSGRPQMTLTRTLGGAQLGGRPIGAYDVIGVRVMDDHPFVPVMAVVPGRKPDLGAIIAAAVWQPEDEPQEKAPAPKKEEMKAAPVKQEIEAAPEQEQEPEPAPEPEVKLEVPTIKAAPAAKSKPKTADAEKAEPAPEVPVKEPEAESPAKEAKPAPKRKESKAVKEEIPPPVTEEDEAAVDDLPRFPWEVTPGESSCTCDCDSCDGDEQATEAEATVQEEAEAIEEAEKETTEEVAAEPEEVPAPPSEVDAPETDEAEEEELADEAADAEPSDEPTKKVDAPVAVDWEKVVWPGASVAVSRLFASCKKANPLPGLPYDFVRVPMPKGSGLAHVMLGVEVKDNQVRTLCYAIPSPKLEQAPAGLEGYTWIAGKTQGYYVNLQDAITGDSLAFELPKGEQI